MEMDTIAARALNATRAAHKPTYVGLRALLESFDFGPRALTAYLRQRCLARDAWRYYPYQILKEVGLHGQPSYRSCLVGSPLTALAEAYTLSLMAGDPAFAVHDRVYSYRWPNSPSSGRNYEYYFSGYECRNRHIADFLSENPDCVAIVTDIKSFYPSADREKLKSKVLGRAERMVEKDDSRIVARFLTNLLDLREPGFSGIPIGTEIGHALGQLALEDVDRTLNDVFGERYFRYVDDILVLCPRSEARQTRDLIRQTIADAGFTLNGDKDDEVTAMEWQSEDRRVLLEPGSSSFESLVEDLLLYLACSPTEEANVQRAFRDEGIPLPVGRFASLARSRRFRGHLRSRYSTVRWWYKAFVARHIWSEQSLVSTARSVRESLRTLIDSLIMRPIPPASMRRRWYTQHWRYALNRLFYLLPPHNYSHLISAMPHLDEFAEHLLLAHALVQGQATELLPLPGRVVSAFCQLWSESESRSPRIDWPPTASRAVAESIAELSLFFTLSPDVGYELRS